MSDQDKTLKKASVLLVDDQRIIAEAVRRMVVDEPDIEFHYCNEPVNALKMASEVKPTVILQDLVMPDIDGLTLVKYFRANPATRDVPLIVLSVKEDPEIKAEAFAHGANDYAVKLPDQQELLARIRYHSSAYNNLIDRNIAYEKLEESQKLLQKELAEAAEYVRTLLPHPMDESIEACWRFIPSLQLGGDAFGYHWIDEEHFGIYLLDVCGHGVGAAMLSISATNVLRTQSLPETDFLNPAQVLTALNSAFPMEKHNNMFFTMWYGVYHKPSKQLTYASGGHPPAILVTGPDREHLQCIELATEGLVIGGMPDATFENATCQVEKFNKLFVFSDGVYEVYKPDGAILRIQEFIKYLFDFASKTEPPDEDLDHIMKFITSLQGKDTFDDDFSIVKFTFHSG